MPLRLIEPRKGKTPFYYVRGSYLGIRVNRSTQTDSKALAKKIIKRWREQIERGEYRSGSPEAQAVEPSERTFADAVIAYVKAGGEGRFLNPALDTLGTKRLSEIDQIEIDNAAAVAMPGKGAAYKNRNFYTPVSAVLKHAGIERKIKRPKGWRGNKSQSWLRPEQAFALFNAADKIEAEFGVFWRVLVYTGMRLSEALSVRVRDVDLESATITLRKTKNGEPRAVYLPAHVVALLRDARRPYPKGRSAWTRLPLPLLGGTPDAKLFRYHKSGALRKKLDRAMKMAGLSFPHREGGFHIACHTYGRWMKRFGGLDTYGLVETDRWRDPDSAERYGRGEPSEAARKADLLPVETSWPEDAKKKIS